MVLLLGLLGFSFPTAEAQVTWTPDGPEGGEIKFLTHDGQQTLFAAGEGGYLYQLDLQTNPDQWQRLGQPMLGNIRSIDIDAQTGVVYVGTSSGLFKKTLRQQQSDWVSLAQETLGGEVYAVTHSNRKIYVIKNDGIFQRSTGYLQDPWQPLSLQGLPAALDAQRLIYAKPFLYLATHQQGIFRKNVHDSSPWVEVRAAPGEVQPYNAHIVGFKLHLKNRQLYICASNGLYRKDLNNQDLLSPLERVFDRSCDAFTFDHQLLFVANGSAIFKKDLRNAQGQWELISSNRVLDQTNTLIVLWNKLYAGTTSGIYMFDLNDPPAGWTAKNRGVQSHYIHTLLDVPSHGLFAGGVDGTMFQKIGQGPWRAFPTSNIPFRSSIRSLTYSDSVLYIGTFNDGVFAKNLNLPLNHPYEQWRRVDTPANPSTLGIINALIVFHGRLYAGTDRGIFEKNLNNPQSPWQQHQMPPNDFNPANQEDQGVLTFAASPQTLYVGTSDGKILQKDFSQNGEAGAWSAVEDLPNFQGGVTLFVRRLLFSENTLYALTFYGIYQKDLSDDRNPWLPLATHPGLECQTTSLAIANQSLYVSTLYCGIYRLPIIPQQQPPWLGAIDPSLPQDAVVPHKGWNQAPLQPSFIVPQREDQPSPEPSPSPKPPPFPNPTPPVPTSPAASVYPASGINDPNVEIAPPEPIPPLQEDQNTGGSGSCSLNLKESPTSSTQGLLILGMINLVLLEILLLKKRQ